MSSSPAKTPTFSNPERGEAARKKLIEAGLKIFSEAGYEAASTRSLAAAAKVNIAAIPYYFGNKQGLYLAVIDTIVDYYRRNIGGGLQKIKQALRNEHITGAECRALLDDYMRMLIHFVLQEGKERSQISHIYIREQLDPTSGFDRLYEGYIRDMHETMAVLVGHVVGAKITASEAKLVAQTLLGQVAIFKSSREAVLHNMGWKNYGDKGMAEIERVVLLHVDAILKAYQNRSTTS